MNSDDVQGFFETSVVHVITWVKYDIVENWLHTEKVTQNQVIEYRVNHNQDCRL